MSSIIDRDLWNAHREYLRRRRRLSDPGVSSRPVTPTSVYSRCLGYKFLI